MAEVTKLLEVEHKFSPAYAPHINGSVEKFNGTLIQSLRHYVNSAGNDWDQYLDMATFAYNTTPSRTTGLSPGELLYGRKMRVPAATLLQNNEDNILAVMATAEEQDYAHLLEVAMRYLWATARDNDQQYRSTSRDKTKSLEDRSTPPTTETKDESTWRLDQLKTRNNRLRTSTIKKGDWVFVYKPDSSGKPKKLQANLVGPYKVTGLQGNKLLQVHLHDKSTPYYLAIFHVKNVKKYRGSFDPDGQPSTNKQQNRDKKASRASKNPHTVIKVTMGLSDETSLQNHSLPTVKPTAITEENADATKRPQRPTANMDILDKVAPIKRGASTEEGTAQPEHRQNTEPAKKRKMAAYDECTSIKTDEVQEVLQQRHLPNNTRQYLARMKDYPTTADAWCSEDELRTGTGKHPALTQFTAKQRAERTNKARRGTE
jgi:hypothetical protein